MQQKEKYTHMIYRTIEASTSIGIKINVFRSRAKVIGLEPKLIGKVFTWTDDDVEKVKAFKKAKPLNSLKYSKKSISIVDFYLTHRNNTQVEIANSMGLNISNVNRVLTDYLETGFVTVASRMNVDNF